MENNTLLKRIFLHSPIRYVVGTCLAVILVFICLISKGFEYRMSYVDAFTIAGGALILIGLLQLVSYYGAFDIFSFSFFRGKDKRYKDYLAYQNTRAEKKKNYNLKFMPFIVVGFFFFSIGLILSAVLL